MRNRQRDIEAPQDNSEYLPGFTDFAEYNASDASLSIYRKFAVLGSRNLLYLQAEIQLLELELDDFEKEDKARLAGLINDDEKSKAEEALRSWEVMREMATAGDKRQIAKLSMIHKLRRLMKEYEKALLRRNQVLQLEKPADIPFHAFKNWFRNKRPFWGSGFRLLHKEEDMVCLGSQPEADHMSSFLHRNLGYWFRKPRKTPKSWGPMYYYPVERVDRVLEIIGIFASAFLLVGAVVALNFVKPRGIRLAMVGAFTLVFATSITLLTHARRIEVYGATAAYVAVLVVFVSVSN